MAFHDDPGPIESIRTELIVGLRTSIALLGSGRSSQFVCAIPPFCLPVCGHRALVFPRISLPISLSYILTRLLRVRSVTFYTVLYASGPRGAVSLYAFKVSGLWNRGQARKRFRAVANPPLASPDIV